MENKDKQKTAALGEYYCIPLNPEKYDYSQGHPCRHYGFYSLCYNYCSCGECFSIRKDVRYEPEGGAE